MQQLFANQAVSTLAAPLSNSATTMQVAAGTGALFPNPTSGSEFFLMTLMPANPNGLEREIVKVTARAADVMTIVRAQEGTLAQAWATSDQCKMLNTAGTMSNLTQKEQAQAQAYAYSLDTGSVNAISAVFNPAITGRVAGLTVRIKVAQANTGAVTANLGAGSIPLKNPDGTEIGTDALSAGGVIEIFDDGVIGNPYQLLSNSNQVLSASGVITTGGVQWRPAADVLSGWVVSNGLTIGNASSNATGLAGAMTSALFAYLWNTFSNTQCPIYTSGGAPTTRGANAAADYAANKAIATFPMQGIKLGGVDTMGGGATTFYSNVPVVSGNATTPGSVLGANLHTLITNELAAHIHANTLTDPTHFHDFRPNHNSNSDTGWGKYTTGSDADEGTLNSYPTNPALTGITINNVSAGGGAAHNNTDRTMVGYWYMKL